MVLSQMVEQKTWILFPMIFYLFLSMKHHLLLLVVITILNNKLIGPRKIMSFDKSEYAGAVIGKR